MNKRDLIFTRGNKQRINYDQMIDIIAEFVLREPNADYEFTVGTDSQNSNHTKMVEVIAVHRVGNGGIFFYNIEHLQRISNLKQKITTETGRSLELADGLVKDLEFVLMKHDVDINELNIRFMIHCDIGHNGKTKALIREITTWVTACGYDCAIKPESYCASGIANKLSKF